MLEQLERDSLKDQESQQEAGGIVTGWTALVEFREGEGRCRLREAKEVLALEWRGEPWARAVLVVLGQGRLQSEVLRGVGN